jgi:hypothetical protein
VDSRPRQLRVAVQVMRVENRAHVIQAMPL